MSVNVSCDNGVGEPRNGADSPKSVKIAPLPRLYVVAAKVLGARLDGKEQQQSFLYRQDKARDLRRIKRLVCLAHEHFDLLIKILGTAGFSFSICDKRLAAVIAADVAFSAPEYLPKSSNSKVREILGHKKSLRNLCKVENINPLPQVSRIRYAILNRLKINKHTLEKMLTKLGFCKKQYEVDPDREPESALQDYWNHLDNLETSEYTWDIHFPDDILVFNSKGEIHMKKLVTEWKQLLLFNKSVLAPVRALGAKHGDCVLDTCAAPGNKSVLVAQSCSTLISCERNEKRYKMMVENFDLAGVASKRDCETIHSDFIKLDEQDSRLGKCNKALVDPSCSGGGDFKNAPDRSRIEKLANLQTMCLKKTLALPSMETVVYSTCSSQSRENEEVVREVLDWTKTQPERNGPWILEKALPHLPFRGNEAEFPDIGDKCLFFNQERSHTSVQFVAKFVRGSTRDANVMTEKTSRKETKKKLKRLRQKQRKHQREKLKKRKK